MTRYRVPLVTEASITVEVEADSVEEAIEAAYENLPSQGWDWPDMGDWCTLSEKYGSQFKPEDDAEVIE